VNAEDAGADIKKGTAEEVAWRAMVFMEKLIGLQPSQTVVFESALHLAEKLQLTDSQTIAFLHFARWVQDLKVEAWAKTEKWAIKSAVAKGFLFLVLGAGGCGKSTFLLVSEVFICFWLGPDSARKVAIANSAARRIGGDTMHALLNLPMSYMGEARAKLKGETLQQFRKEFDVVRVLFIDECANVACVQWFQTDLRLKQAKKKMTKRYGDMGMVKTGDLLQLPPVRRASVCDPKPVGRKREAEGSDEMEQPKAEQK